MTLLELLGLLRKHIRLVIALPIITAVACAAGTLLLPDQYTASSTMYVLSSDSNKGDSGVTNTDLSASQMLTNDVVSITKSDRVKAQVASNLGMSSLAGYSLEVESSTTTRVVTVSVTGANPQTAADIANEFVNVARQTSSNVIGSQVVNTIDTASAPMSPSGPKRPLYVAVAFVAGLLVAIFLVVLGDMVNVKVRTESDVEDLLGVTVIGHFPKIS